MKNITKKSWRDVSINDYYKICDILEDKDLSASEKDIAIIAILDNIEEDKVWDMNIEDVKKMIADAKWVNEFKLSNKSPKHLALNGEKYKVVADLTKFTVAQYVDFQSFFKKRPRRDYIGNIMACLIIPEGKEYANGYDIQELAKEVPEQMDIMTCQEILNFFVECCLTSIRATLISLEIMKKKILRKKTANKEEIIKQMEEVKKTILDGWRGLVQ